MKNKKQIFTTLEANAEVKITVALNTTEAHEDFKTRIAELAMHAEAIGLSIWIDQPVSETFTR